MQRQVTGSIPSLVRYQNIIELLKLAEVDYRLARKELEEVSSRFSERETMVRMSICAALEAVGAESPTSAAKLIGAARQLHHGHKAKEPSSEVLAQLDSTMEVHCLGAFRVRTGLVEIETWPSLKAKSLLEYLVAHNGRPASKELLMEVLWPGCEPALSNNNLKSAVRSLRQTLSSDQKTDDLSAWIVFQDGNYAVNPKADIWCDVQQFEYHWSKARQAAKQGRHSDEIAELEAAESLYKGDYLEDNLYEDWTLLRREALKDTYLTILSRLAESALSNSDYHGCVDYCQKILQKDTCREDAYHRLVLSHSRLGQRSRAIGWYKLCEKTLGVELGVAPDRQLSATYRKLLKGEEV